MDQHETTRRLASSAAAHMSWANTEDRTARTAPARDGLERRFLRLADGDPQRAESLRRAYFADLTRKSVEARARKKIERASTPPLKVEVKDEQVEFAPPRSMTSKVLAAAVERQKPVPQAKKVALYRHFDRAGNLLYVGISNNLRNRGSQHATSSDFMPFTKSSTTEWFDTRADAEVAERAAIKREEPLFNVAHANPLVQRRLVEYLVEHKALHLLTPASAR